MENIQQDESFAAYLAKNYLAKEGYRPDTVEEAALLIDAADFVLTYSDGLNFRIVCIVDRESHPDKTFSLTPEQVREIAKACRRHTGTIYHAKIPAEIRVIEVSSSPAASDDLARLSGYTRGGLFAKGQVSAWHISTAEKTVWSNYFANGLFAGRKFIEKLLRSPRIGDEHLFEPQTVSVEKTKFPLVTCALIAVMAAIFGAEYVFPVGKSAEGLSPGLETLVALGGLNGNLVADGEWFRLFSSIFLHGGFAHILMNGIALYMAGSILEGLIGRRHFLSLFAIGGLGGGLASILLNPPYIVSVGASGAIMGLLAAVFVFSFRFPNGVNRAQLQMTSMQMLLPSLLPIFWAAESHVDYANHLGGAIAGALAAIALMKSWSRTESMPGLAKLASGLLVGWLAVLGYSGLAVASTYSDTVVALQMIPADQMPQSQAEMSKHAERLVQEYPKDPSAHWFLAMLMLMLEQGDHLKTAEALREGLDAGRQLGRRFNPELRSLMQGVLALLTAEKGNLEEARSLAKDECAKQSPISEELVTAGVCS